MADAGSPARKKRDRSARSTTNKRSPAAGFPPKPLARLAAAHEAVKTILAEPPTTGTIQALATALRQVFQAEVVVLRTGELPPLEAVSPRGTDVQIWTEWLEAPKSGAAARPATTVIDVSDPRAVAVGVERIVAVPIESTAARGALWLGFGKKAAFSEDDMVTFDLIGDFLAIALRQSASLPPPLDATGAQSNADLVSQAAHDLRTPLTPISMLLQTLERKAVVGAVDLESVGRARRQVQRLADMVSDLVDLSRLREGRLVLEPTVMDLRDVFNRAAVAFSERDRRRKLELSLGDEPLWIVGDTDRTVHAVASLMEHVARLAQGDAPIRATIARRNSHVTLQIDSERCNPISGLRLELGASIATQRTPPWGLGVRLADALFSKLGGTLRIEGVRDGSAKVDATFPLSAAPAGERSTG